MNEFAVMPIADYKSVCDAIRERVDSVEIIKSGELADKVRQVFEVGKTDLTELIALQEDYIYGGNNDMLHLAVDTDGSIYGGVGYKLTADGYYETGYIPCTSEDAIYVKNIEFAEDTPIVCQAENIGDSGTWYSIGDDWLEIAEGGNVKTLSFSTQNPFVEYIRLRFKSYRYIPIVTINEPIGGDGV